MLSASDDLAAARAWPLEWPPSNRTGGLVG
jgi:hypothetical protein